MENTNENTQVVENNEDTSTETKPTIDLNKFDEGRKEPKKETELEKLQRELIETKRNLEKSEERANKFKSSFDDAASELAKKKKADRDIAKTLEQEDAEKEAMRKQLAEYEMKQKKTDLLYSFRDNMGITQEMSDSIVSAIYYNDTNEVSIGDLQIAFSSVIDFVREESFKKGYETRDTEMASNKPRSIGGVKGETIEQRKIREYSEKRSRK